MSKINVLHVTYDMRIGGTEQVIKNLIEASDSTRFEMSILCIESPVGPFGEQMQVHGIQITSFNRQPGFDSSLIKSIRQHIKQYNIDVVHCHQYTPWIYGVLAALFTKAKVIYTEHGRFYPDSTTWKRKLVNPWLHRITHATTCISKATKQALVEFEHLPEEDIQVIYNGITPLSVEHQVIIRLQEELGISNSTLCLGTIARLDPIKNHELMLRSFRQVLDSGIDAKLLIVGDGEMREHIEAVINELQIQRQVILTGYITNPQNYLAVMDIYLLSSLSEGTSMTLLEAMSLGKPCVVTNAGGNSEIIEHSDNGLVSENGNAEAFATSILKLAQNPKMIRDMGIHSCKRYEIYFSAHAMAELYGKTYRTLNKL